MPKIISPIILVLLLLSLLLNGYFLFQKSTSPPDATVETVIDGDTVKLTNGERIRLLGVDAPEIDRCYGKESQQALEKMVLNQKVTITETKPDNYGRTMGLVYLNGTLINTWMVAEGFAKPDYTKNSHSQEFITAYAGAKKEKKGINSDICKRDQVATPPNPACIIKGNIDPATGNKFYHLPTCRQYNQIVIDLSSEEGYFCSETEAQAAGFIKAGGCP
jgi:micrococcal nuclease